MAATCACLLVAIQRPRNLALAGDPPHVERRLATPTTAEIAELLKQLFSAITEQQRLALIARIVDASANDVSVVLPALRDTLHWPELAGTRGSFNATISAAAVAIEYLLPDGYDPKLAYPTVVCLIGQSGAAGTNLASVRAELGDTADGFVFVCPRLTLPRSFRQEQPAVRDWHRVLTAVRSKIHTDTSRTYLYGSGAGADSAWMVGLMFPDDLAGMIIHGGHPRIPYARQVLPLLVPNLKHLPVVATWPAVAASPAVATPQGAEASQESRRWRMAEFHRTLYHSARRAGVSIVGIERSPSENLVQQKELRVAVAQVLSLSKDRDALASNVEHRFRYEGQGGAGWLLQTSFLGRVWDEEQIAIATGLDVDRDQFIADTIADRLALLRGSVDGQTIHIETGHCAGIDVLFSHGLVDLTKQVTIYCNGKRRFKGIVRPDVRTMLEHAIDSWDVEDPVVAVVSISIRSER